MDTPTSFPPYPGAPMGGPQVENPSGQTFKVPEVSNNGPSSKSKLLVYAVLVLIFMVGGGGGYYFYFLKGSGSQVQATPTPEQQAQEPTAVPDPYAEWNAYTNGTYTYSIRFPADWAADISKAEDPIGNEGFGGQVRFIAPDSNVLSFMVFRKDPNMPLSSFDSVFASATTVINKVIDVGIGSGGRQYELQITDQVGTKIVVRTIFALDDKLYSFQGNLNDKPIYDQILSTFQFTRQ